MCDLSDTYKGFVSEVRFFHPIKSDLEYGGNKYMNWAAFSNPLHIPLLSNGYTWDMIINLDAKPG